MGKHSAQPPPRKSKQDEKDFPAVSGDLMDGRGPFEPFVPAQRKEEKK